MTVPAPVHCCVHLCYECVCESGPGGLVDRSRRSWYPATVLAPFLLLYSTPTTVQYSLVRYALHAPQIVKVNRSVGPVEDAKL